MGVISARRSRTGAIIGGAVCAVVLLLAAGGYIVRSHGQANLTGGVFTDTPVAPDFKLIDQNGQSVQMSGQRGKVVALTFLYTHCPDVCPLIASNMAAANKRLGPDASKVEMLAVSVDPRGDTLPAVKQFTADRGLADMPNWHYLIGSPSQLEAVWQAYHVGSNVAESPDAAAHSAMVYVADPSGKLRAILSANFAVSDLVQDIEALKN